MLPNAGDIDWAQQALRRMDAAMCRSYGADGKGSPASDGFFLELGFMRYRVYDACRIARAPQEYKCNA